MANSKIWNDNPNFISGTSTPFNFYDDDPVYRMDANKVARFCATRLGYPTLDVEMDEYQFFTCFEEAITTYGNEVYLYQIRNNYLALESTSASIENLNNLVITPGISNIIKISEDYGSEVGVGGNVTYYSGSINMKAGNQNYDLKSWALSSASLSPNDSIEVKQVFYENNPAIMRYFDPYVGTGYGSQQMLDSFGMAGQSPAINFMMMPLNFDVSVIQAIELNDTIRKSAFSFSIIDNQLKIFPIPRRDYPLHFVYVKKSDKNQITPSIGEPGGGLGNITNMSNVPYKNPIYTQINGPGRYWIFEYTLALAKELLGLIRGKYQSLNIPGDNITLNNADLLSQAAGEKTALLEKLRSDLDETSRKSQLARRKEELESAQSTINQVPMMIFIG